MRPISEVLTAARQLFHVSAHPRADAAWHCLKVELEEWEKELAIDVQYEGKPFGDTESRLAQIRHYLGRTPRLDEITRQRVLANERDGSAAEPKISQETARRLIDACEMAERWDTDDWMRWSDVLARLQAALAQARAELAGEEDKP